MFAWETVWQETQYLVNYGDVSGLLGGDESEQDIYLFLIRLVSTRELAFLPLLQKRMAREQRNGAS